MARFTLILMALLLIAVSTALWLFWPRPTSLVRAAIETDIAWSQARLEDPTPVYEPASKVKLDHLAWADLDRLSIVALVQTSLATPMPRAFPSAYRR